MVLSLTFAKISKRTCRKKGVGERKTAQAARNQIMNQRMHENKYKEIKRKFDEAPNNPTKYPDGIKCGFR